MKCIVQVERRIKMLSLAFGRSIFPAQTAWRCAAPPQRCWISTPVRASRGGSVRHSPPSSVRKEPDAGQAKTALLCGFTRAGLLQGPQNRGGGVLAAPRYFHCSAARLKKRPKKEPLPRELDLLRYDIKDLWKGPRPALYLGFAGLLPFVAPPLVMAVSECYMPELAYAQVAYGAAIISFLGGARWGFALPESSPANPDWVNLSNSVVPSLVAWAAMLMCDDVTAAAVMVVMGLGISLHYDLSLLPTYPSWLKALRSVFTAVAFFSLIGTLVIGGVYEKTDSE